MGLFFFKSNLCFTLAKTGASCVTNKGRREGRRPDRPAVLQDRMTPTAQSQATYRTLTRWPDVNPSTP